MERLKTLWRVIMVFSVSLLMLGLVHMVGGQSQPATSLTVEALSKYGSQGSEVRQIQTKLKNWGYYFGQVDGIYGSETQEAVRFFQRKNKLQVDGIAGPKTLEAMGIMGQGNTGGNGQYSQSDFNLLARMISAEARGEPYSGQVAVGAVIMNRIEHPSFPNTLAGVLYQPGAFSALYDGQFEQPIADSAYRAAQDALNGVDPSGGAIYYYNPTTATNQWIRSRPIITRIGQHVFCS
ncbi:spore cortex-lytic enzyme [Solibaculum mannosilyticum]|uniref:Spore cortex-lytic enzyme n=1 Tax=Solibaculum mannosilyticum TaxID=2780922 RepID=A0A7I8D8N7_9FIRM|nr:spore cortex-lytic enzyme [Solibaculum mannosilyticum]MCO7137237.1 spore cortex-lytic enzyme [[Clostridium] leptum]BCI61573.1 spore cortex-lytic enzyme [Solibaculum mannosilyticum]CZT55671.1 Spore cortex-lytic enzyme precursor [Eubacteriaceae bacterium CHKCI005]